MNEPITKIQAMEIAKETAHETVKQTFALMGVDVHDFNSMERFRDDLDWVRRYRRLSESVGSKVIITFTTVLTGGFLTAFWLFLQDVIKKP